MVSQNKICSPPLYFCASPKDQGQGKHKQDGGHDINSRGVMTA